MSETYSVLVHLQRTVVLDAYVSVPVTEELLRQEADGSHRLNTDKLFAAARELGNDRRVDWQVESSDTQVHGIQKPLPEDRVTFNPFLADGAADESPDQEQNPGCATTTEVATAPQTKMAATHSVAAILD